MDARRLSACRCDTSPTRFKPPARGRIVVQRTRLTVDALDMRILREIVSGGSAYFRGDRALLDDVAQGLGVHRNTVSERVTRMQTNGFFLPLTLEVDPSAVGLVAVIAALDIPIERRDERTRSALLAVEGSWGILTYLDAWLLLVHATDEATIERRIAEACEASGGRLAEIEANSLHDYPDARPVELSPLDVRIVAALMTDARAPFRSIAAELGVTARTVERRYARLEREGVVTLFPTGGAGASGLTIADLRIALPDDAKARATAILAIEKLVPDHWFHSLRPRGLVHFGLFAASVSELDERAAAVRAVPGVRRVGLRIWTGQFQSPSYAPWLLRHLEERARATIAKDARPSRGPSSR